VSDARPVKAPAGADDVVSVGPEDEGFGNIRPDEVAALGADDEGLGNIRPDQVVPLDPDDEGLGNVRADINRLEPAR
jgi:hypothetical protein